MTASSNKSMMQKLSRSEEAHWSSFRAEVLQLQQSLLDKNNNGCSSSSTNSKASRDINVNRRKDNAACYAQYDSKAKNDSRQIEATVVDENDTAINNIYRDTSTETNKVPQSQLLQLSPLDELDDDDNSDLSNNDSNNDKSIYNATQPQHHQYLELIGMEEVDRSICSLNNKSNLSSHDNNCIISTNNNNNAMSHASQNTNALSIATQELAEMKLKLALTESERDELEFELMQSR